MTTLNISNAQLSDIPALNQLIVRSARELSRGFYTGN